MPRRRPKKPSRRERRRSAGIGVEPVRSPDEGITVYREEREEWSGDESDVEVKAVDGAPSGLNLPAIPAFAELRGEPELAEASEAESQEDSLGSISENVDELPSVFGTLGIEPASDMEGDESKVSTSRLRAVPDVPDVAISSTLIPPAPGEPEEYVSVESAAPILEQLPGPEDGHESESLEELAETASAHWRDRPEDWEAEAEAWEEITAEWKRLDEQEAQSEQESTSPAEDIPKGEEDIDDGEVKEDRVPLSLRETQPLPAVSESESSRGSDAGITQEAVSDLPAEEDIEKSEVLAGEVPAGEDLSEMPGPPTQMMDVSAELFDSEPASEAPDHDALPLPPPPQVRPVPRRRGLFRVFSRKRDATPTRVTTDVEPVASSLSVDKVLVATEEAPPSKEPEMSREGEPSVISECTEGTSISDSSEAKQDELVSLATQLEPSPDSGEDARLTTEQATAPKKRNVFVAIATGLVFAAVAITAIVAGPGYFALLVMALVVIGQVEFFTAVRHAGFQPAPIVSLIGGIAMIWGGITQGAVALLFALFITILATFLWYYTGVIKTSPVANASVTVLGAIYLGFLPGVATLIVGAPTPHPSWRALVVFFLAVAIASDVGGYAFGSWFGKHKVVTSISPKKSIEGYLGGLVLALVVAMGVAVAGRFLENSFSYWHFSNALVAGLVVAIAAPVGDLVESMLKRSLEVKDMGSFLPGHGGVLDRVDSLLAVVPVFYAYLYISAMIQS